MAIITEDYVSFEIAKLLKEKGFKGQGEHFYENDKIIDYINYWYRITPKQRYEAIEAPTLQMTMKWLREEHSLFIRIELIPHTTVTMEQRYYYYNLFKNRRIVSLKQQRYYYSTYEEAAEAAIKYCLEKLIK